MFAKTLLCCLLTLTFSSTLAAQTLSCDHPTTPIAQVQSIDFVSPNSDKAITVSGVVTMVAPGLKGFFLQDPLNTVSPMGQVASAGLFINHIPDGIKIGDLLLVTGTTVERDNNTQLEQVTAVSRCGQQDLPDYQPLTLPLKNLAQAEALEGMRVRLTQALTVTDVYQLAAKGQFEVSLGRRYAPTQLHLPSDANSYEKEQRNNLRNRLIIDDGSNQRYPAHIRYPQPGLTADNTLRVGDTMQPVTGVLMDSPNGYQLVPDEPVSFKHTNPRPQSLPEHSDVELYIASFNVLNFFNGDGEGKGFPTARGADSATEFTRQQDKILNAMAALHADIIGLMEVENDGYGDHSAIAQLTAALAKRTHQPWHYIKPATDKLGSDAIAVGLIYRSDKVQPQGHAQILDRSNSPRDAGGQSLFVDTRNRPSLAQQFIYKKTGQHLVTVVNHLKSKGSPCDDLGDPNKHDGQGNCNQTRTRAAQALATWLDKQYEKQPVLLLGDFNAYSKEDPIRVLGEAGYHSLFALLDKEPTYSFVFRGQSGQLDHALANDKLASYVLSAEEWHINADEPPALDYNIEHKTADQQQQLYNDGPYRSSDHDPLRIGLSFDPARR